MFLSSLIFLPVLFALVFLVKFDEQTQKKLALGLSLVHFALTLALLFLFDKGSHGLQLAYQIPWIADFGISYFVGVDGLSLWLVVLSSFLMPLVVLGTWDAVPERRGLFYGSLFFLQSSMIGTFLAFDAILFYTFFEIGLVPMYLIIGIWGGQRRLYATVKFFIYTMAGSVFMLMGIIYLMLMCNEQLGQMSASLLDFYQLEIPFLKGTIFSVQSLLFFAFCFAFCIKVPTVPFHTWLPDAHVEAPTAGSVILAGVLLKMGTYGIMRFAIPLFPEAAEHWAWLFMFVGTLGVVYGALIAMVQPDIKKLVAYSSVSHMGYIVAGLFSFGPQAAMGSLYQMLNHGISTGGLFFMVGMIYERTHSREIAKYGGLASRLPIFTIFFFIITFSSIAVPLTNGFIGEFLILMGLFQASPFFGAVAVSGVVLGAAYMLWMCRKVFFGEQSDMVKDSSFSDLNLREKTVLVPLVVLIFWMGLVPAHFFRFSEKSVMHWSENYKNYQIEVVGLSSAKEKD